MGRSESCRGRILTRTAASFPKVYRALRARARLSLTEAAPSLESILPKLCDDTIAARRGEIPEVRRFERFRPRVLPATDR